MSSAMEKGLFLVPPEVNFVSQGQGKPVILVHGLAASLHDWDFLIPDLVDAGYAAFALDLLGHGESPHPNLRDYKMDWLVDHFFGWVDSLELREPAVLIAHSLGAYLTLEYAARFPERVRGLLMADPFYASSQLPASLRLFYRTSILPGFIARRTPDWLFRFIIDLGSRLIEHGVGGLSGLPEEVRDQIALDYEHTAPGAYNVLNKDLDLTPLLDSIGVSTLVLWGERDRVLATASYEELVEAIPNASGAHVDAGHVPHQLTPSWFNARVLEFLKSLR